MVKVLAMKMSKVGNQTNSQDPQAVNSRVFVGNLNTFQCSKTDVERMFQRYGRLAGISMHKGYAFVQFTNPFDARSACLGEDGRTVLSQILDSIRDAPKTPEDAPKIPEDAPKTPEDAPKTHEDAPKIYEDARNCAKFYRVRVVPAQIMASVILCAISQ